MPTNLENSAVATGLEKFNFLSNHKEGQCQRVFKLPHNYTFHMLAMQCLKSFKTRFNCMGSESFQVYKLDLEKAEEPEIKLQSSVVSPKKDVLFLTRDSNAKVGSQEIPRVTGKLGLEVENEADVFLEFSCFVYDSPDVLNLISSSSAFSKSSLKI